MPANYDDDRLEAAADEIRDLRKELDLCTEKAYRLSQSLATKAKRSTEDSARGYLLFANAHLRLAGALAAGLKRVSSVDRIISRGMAAQEEEKAKPVPQAPKAVEPLRIPVTEVTFEDVYGEFVEDNK